jgi:hypothetical protein
MIQGDHESQHIIKTDGSTREFRFYMVGKLVRQDLIGDDYGYRETLQCPCHRANEHLKIFGPMHYPPRYSAHCLVDGEMIAEGDTMEELWSAVKQVDEVRQSKIQTVIAARQAL